MAKPVSEQLDVQVRARVRLQVYAQLSANVYETADQLSWYTTVYQTWIQVLNEVKNKM